MKKQIRLILLKRQTDLNDRHCKVCLKNVSKFHNTACDGCKVYDELRDIGDKLLNINNYTINSKGEITMVGLTVERYNELKEKGHTDKKIMAEFGMDHNKFYKWKNENGLIGNSKFSKNKTVENTEDTKSAQVLPASDHEKLKLEIKQLRAENDKLNRDIKEQIIEIESLEEKVQAYEEEIEKYKQKLSIHEELLVEINKLKESSINTKSIQRTRQLNVLLMQELIELGGQQ